MNIPDSNPHYVDNAEFLAAIVEYKAQCADAEAKGLPRPRIPEYIGSCLLKVAAKFSFSASYSKNFVGYPFREDMVMDGVETCVRYFHNFDPAKSSNPFSYFTQICYYSFISRIQREKKHLYTKFKAVQNQRELGIMADSQEHEELAEFGVDIQDNNDYMNDYISNFEKSSNDKKKAKLEGKKPTGAILDEFIDDPQGDIPDIGDQDE